ncbi:MAG: type I glyceraldehyde-3-phosphate dehydrogenase [Candidatus Magasanikbacteria bacterium]|nr:type I glyceraldehyde-3-phosphate dehydrogenase [Candidatus Magasanikbacteria bacterium]
MKKIRAAINGFGRIGRHSFKAAWDRGKVDVVAVNDLTDNKTLSHLLKYDTAYPDFPEKVSYDEKNIIVGRRKIKCFSEKDPLQLPWKKLKIDVVVESTGVFRKREDAVKHIEAGAKKVIISAPGKSEGIKTFIRGVNCKSYKKEEVIDNASCTTNSAAPVMRVMEKKFGVKKAFLTTIHSYTADQNLQDGPHKDLRRARAAAQNIVPTTTGAAIATTKVIKNLENKFDGIAVRVPTITVSLSDFVMHLKKKTTVETVNKAFIKASETYLKGIMAVSDEPLVSSDFIGNSHSAIVDLSMTKVIGGDLLKVVAWYDNEWAYAQRMAELMEIVGK